ncbi:hypothetical protein RvY_15082 [Ramazzottius varieornatus]|uniref:Glutaminyl-peptide cyclotransferase n=1 Tax=Ramazzottius varieornatus TaxID=947166 RepID=A0A1D1W0M7_RAMVA|nr:hypothetical protein RvY_15082 [Ramazzottius varieornatus]
MTLTNMWFSLRLVFFVLEWPALAKSSKHNSFKADDAMQMYYMALAMDLDMPSTVKPLPGPEVQADAPGRSLPNFTTLTSPQRKTLNDLSDRNRFMDTVKAIAIPRASGTPGNLKVQQHIVRSMENLCYDVELDTFEADLPGNLTSQQMTNIIATLNPDAPRRLVLACHFDSKYDKKGAFVGAIDSAVPCAMMIDLAHTLNPYINCTPVRNKNLTLQMIFFDGEEAFVKWSANDSLYGSRNLAVKMDTQMKDLNRNVTELDKIDVMVLLDLIGSKETQFRRFYYSAKYHFEHLANIEKELTVSNDIKEWDNQTKAGVDMEEKEVIKEKVYFDTTPLPAGLWIDDDYRPFMEKGVKVLHLISYPFPAVWHKQSDTVANIHYDTVDDLNKIFRIYVCEYLGCQI